MSARSFFQSIAKLFGKGADRPAASGRSQNPRAEGDAEASRSVGASGESREIPIHFIQADEPETKIETGAPSSGSVVVEVSEKESSGTIAVSGPDEASHEEASEPIQVIVESDDTAEASNGPDEPVVEPEEPVFEWVEVPFFTGIGGYLPPRLIIDRVGTQGTRRSGTIGGRRNEVPGPRTRRNLP